MWLSLAEATQIRTLADHGARWVAEIILKTWSISTNLYVHAIAYEHVI
jgi:hypothetical protein